MSKRSSSSSASSSSSSSSSSLLLPLSKKQRVGDDDGVERDVEKPRVALVRDTITVVMEHLTHKEFFRSIQLSHEWYSSGAFSRSRGMRVQPWGDVHIKQLTKSHMAKHIGCMVIPNYTPVTPSRLLPLLANLPHLQELQLTVALSYLVARDLALPHTIHKLAIEIYAPRKPVSTQLLFKRLTAVLTCIGSLALLESLRLEFWKLDACLEQEENVFAPLHKLNRLQSIQLSFSDGSAPPIRQSHVSFFLSLPSIESIRCDESSSLLQMLAENENCNKLTSFHSYHFKAADVPHLLRLLSLRELELREVTFVPSFLLQIKHLHHLALGVDVATDDESDQVADILAQLVALTHLDLILEYFEPRHLEKILKNMNQLQTLKLNTPYMKSLRFLSATPHIVDRLQELHVQSCRWLRVKGLEHILQLRALRRLTIEGSFDRKLTTIELALFRPSEGPLFSLSAKVMPPLVDFTYVYRIHSSSASESDSDSDDHSDDSSDEEDGEEEED